MATQTVERPTHSQQLGLSTKRLKIEDFELLRTLGTGAYIPAC